MNLTQIELLRVLQETDFNQSKAAAKLNVVQSAASRQLQLFEEELGAPLFERQGKRLVGLTDLGQRIMAEVEQINQSRKNIESIASDFHENASGMLNIATTHTQAKYLLPTAIREFREQYPAVTIFMVQSSPGEVVDLLNHHKVDIAICTEKLVDNDKLVITPCYQWQHIAVVPKHHPLLSGDISLQRLASYPLLTYSPGYTGRSIIEKAFNQAGLDLDVTLSAADSDVIKTYVRLGLGVGIIASSSYEPDNDSDLQRVDLSHLIPRATTKVAYLKQLYIPQYLQYFIDHVLAAGRQLDAQTAEAR
jgi:DNA-binding transcriptional LysR family regulator